MIYSSFKDKKISSLGMGCMRLPTRDDKIDMDATREMFDYAIKNGVNYFDTAWMYHSGQSEKAVGEILKAYPRDSFYLATKFPAFVKEVTDKVEEVFETQLKNCMVDYFDFYLFHNVCEADIDAYLDPKYRVHSYLTEQKRNGRIKHLGFSTHAGLETFKRFLDAYGEDMEFCQIQLNWLDWDFQDAKAKVALLNEYNIPIIVMEPVRGGSLTRLAPQHEKMLKELCPKRTMAEWAFRFVQSVDGVMLTLSGMSDFAQLKENIATFSTPSPLTDTQKNTLFEIAKDMTSKKKLPCTACRYCVDGCPQGLDIPTLIELYNKHVSSGGVFKAPRGSAEIEEGKRPSDCLHCLACESACPQNLAISDMMEEFGQLL